MVKRLVVLLAAMVPTLPAVAGDMSAEEARRFVVGKQFAFACFDGTKGLGRIYADGSVAGTIQLQGKGPMRYAAMPAGTLKVKGESVCASVKPISSFAKTALKRNTVLIASVYRKRPMRKRTMPG